MSRIDARACSISREHVRRILAWAVGRWDMDRTMAQNHPGHHAVDREKSPFEDTCADSYQV
jgi:hypothetical protein